MKTLLKNKLVKLRSPNHLIRQVADDFCVMHTGAVFCGRNLAAGAGSIFDVAGSNLPTLELESLQDDAAKLRSDFYKIGNDLRDISARVHLVE